MFLGIASNLVLSLQRRRKSNNHNVVGIQGDPGVGKSTLGLGLALNLEPDFGVTHVHYNRDDWKGILNAPKGSVFLLDEGANVAMNRTWQDRSQVQLMQILNMIRQRNHTLIWCTPNLQRLDVVIREDLLTHKINCTKRGEARVRTRRFDRDGEHGGWVTWPGLLSWPSLDQHPIWEPYSEAKASNYRKAVAQATKAPKKISDENAELEAALGGRYLV